jgi:hypothetical protein
VTVDLAWHIERPRRIALAACLVLAACNQASPSAPLAATSVTPSPGATPIGTANVRATDVPSSSATASPGASQVAPPASPPTNGSAPSVDTGPVGIRVVESGFTGFAADGNDVASYAAILENPNRGWAALQMQVTIDFFDADDTFIAGEELFVRVVPGQRTAIAGEAFGAGRATRMTVNLPDDTTAFEQDRTSSDLLRVSGVETTRRDGLNVTRGRLTSRGAAAVSSVQLTAVYRDRSGDIIGGAAGGVDSIAPGAAQTFEIIDSLPFVAMSATEVYWQISGVRR